MKVPSFFLCLPFWVFANRVVAQEKSTAEPTLSFALPFNQTKEVTLTELKKEIKEGPIAVYEPHIPGGVSDFVGFPLIKILDKYLGDKWRKSEGILFHALDGYKYDIAVTKILKYNPFLVYSFKDPKKEFKVDIPAVNQKDVPLGPYYLVWDNINNPKLVHYGYYDWPYQIGKLESILYPLYYASAFPIENPTPAQLKGFEFYKAYCISCHSISGTEGGKKGDIITPHPLVAQHDLKKFKEWVLDPKKMKPDTQMPSLNKQFSTAERNEVAELIFTYLTAVSNGTKKSGSKKKSRRK